ncbi:hypothetical protein FisN_34Hh014 [Fistulifera solaris]|uniref:NB-ARC domain-containing protein n=1 Tax=Fistulifera solaris TaxID=1519565 RepID=A0A1Z5KR56_FISSO|nr:hypothetical protein FisN_34Hh014 [Fistulifera solaris]|eukprot:GAX28804.1 hypothetical protein FisN_34Hh014 [Fistulifera solaris]
MSSVADLAEETKLPENLIEFDKLVEDAYQQEIALFTIRGQSIPTALSVHDLTENTKRREETRLDVIDAWRRLLQQMKHRAVFIEHVTSLERAFLDIEDIHKTEYRRLITLVDLLTQTVEHSDRDVSCRFVTLLEVLLSYSDDWVLSNDIAPFWERLQHEVPASKIAPASFRRRAYRVLVSLSWVPSSSGLLDACSFDFKKLTTNYADAPTLLQREVFWKIRGGQPRPRHDSVNQILDRLKDEAGVCISIWSTKDGMGKTTLAAQVASNPSILRVFTVVWLNLDKEEMSYAKYIEYLSELSRQMSVDLRWPDAVDRIEERGLRQVREQSLMSEARKIMAEYVEREELSVLLILDDLIDSRWIKWFQFSDSQSIILTTLKKEIDGVDWPVQLGVMDEGEAIELFLTESSLPVDHILGTTAELKEIVTRCEFNPLTVRSVARWFHLKQVTAGHQKAIEEILFDMESLAQSERRETSEDEHEEMDPNMFVFDVLSLMMGPTTSNTNITSVVFVLCFAALEVVFPHRVPLDAVLLLWEQALATESLARDELQVTGVSQAGIPKLAWFIAEGLIHMGVIHVFDDEQGNPWVQIHHKLYGEFAALMAREMFVKASFEVTASKWNEAFVTTFVTRRIQVNMKEATSCSMEYALRRLPEHMLKGNMLTTAEKILTDEQFFKARIDTLGWDKAMDIQLLNCVALQERFGEELEGGVTVVFRRTVDMVKELAGKSFDSVEHANQAAAHIYNRIGFLLTGLKFYGIAIGYLEEVQRMNVPDAIVATSLYGEGICHLNLNQTDIGLQKAKNCHSIMELGSDLHVLYTNMLQLVSSALVAACHYTEAAQFYHVICDKLRADPEKWKLELSSILLGQAQLFSVLGDFENAETFFLECLQMKERANEKSLDLVSAYSYLGDVFIELDRADDAKERYEAAIDILSCLNADDIDGEIILLLKGKLHFLRGDYYSSSEAFTVSADLINKSPTLLLDKSAYDLRFMARTFFLRGESEKAVELLKASLELSDERPISLERAAGLTDLAHSLIDMGNLNEGITFLENALEIQITHFGESLFVVDRLKAIGGVHCALKAYDEAIAVYDKIREILQRVHSEDTDRMADIIFAIGDVLEQKGEVDEAIQAFTQFIKVVESTKSSDHPEIARSYQRMGEIELKRHSVDEAEGHFTKAYAIRKVHNQDSLIAETSHFLGVLARMRRDQNLALEYLTSALEVRKGYDKAGETCLTLFEIGNVYRMQWEYDSAISVYDKGLEMIDKSSEMAGRIENAKGHVMVGKGDLEDSLSMFSKFRETRLERFGRDHILTGNTSRSLGLVHFLLNHVDEALVHLNEFVRVCELQEDEDTSETIDYAMAVFLLGELHHHKGKTDQAEEVWTVSKEVCEDNGFDAVYPEFFAMVSRRLEPGAEAKPKSTGLFSRLTGEAQILTDPDERRVLQQIAFMDDE